MPPQPLTSVGSASVTGRGQYSPGGQRTMVCHRRAGYEPGRCFRDGFELGVELEFKVNDRPRMNVGKTFTCEDKVMRFDSARCLFRDEEETST